MAASVERRYRITKEGLPIPASSFMERSIYRITKITFSIVSELRPSLTLIAEDNPKVKEIFKDIKAMHEMEEEARKNNGDLVSKGDPLMKGFSDDEIWFQIRQIRKLRRI